MNAKDYTEIHSLVEQFQGEMTIRDICRQEGVDYRSYISWRKRKGYCKSRKPSAPPTLIEVEVTEIPESSSAGTAKVHLEFENGLVLDREVMSIECLIEFLDKIKPVLCLS